MTAERSSHDKVVQWIQEGLNSGRYAPGQKLVEGDLIATLGVSRGPVREALKRLHGKGIVDLLPHRGAHVRAFTRHEAHDLLVVLEPLTSLMARLAATAVAEGATTESLADIREWIERFRRGEITDVFFVGKRQTLYETLMRIGRNRELPHIMPVELLHLLRLQSFPYIDGNRRQDILAEYIAIIEAVLAGDAYRAARCSEAHLAAAQRRLAALPREAFPAPQGERE